MNNLNEEEKLFILKQQKYYKKKWLIDFIPISIVSLSFAAIGFISAFTRFKFFNYDSFAALMGLLWIGLLLINFLFKKEIKRYLSVIEKLMAE